MKLYQFKSWIGQHWFKLVVAGMFVFTMQQKDLNLQFNLSAQPAPTTTQAIPAHLPTATDETAKKGWLATINPFTMASSLTGAMTTQTSTTEVYELPASTPDPNIANTYSNLTYGGTKEHPAQPKRVLTAAERAKLQKQQAYVSRFVKVAQAEMRKYGIPASIKLAQGLVETNAGASRLSTKNNNHFGMKCFSKKCKKGHCSNFTDDSHKDFFRIYKSAWASYRSHSEMLTTTKRYRPLFELAPTDYRGWAHGLSKAGYATDKQYAEKLIRTIEELQLYVYDE